MRLTLLALLVPLATVGCDGKPVTGPEAQRVVAQAKDRHGTLISGALVLVDGVRLASDKSLQEFDPTTVETVEVLKGDAPLSAARQPTLHRARGPPSNKRLKLAARVDYGMNLSSARRSLSAIR